MKYVLGFFMVSMSFFATKATTLDDVVKKAYEHSLEVDIAIADQRQAEEGLSQAERGWFPTVSAQLSTETTFTNTKSSSFPPKSRNQSRADGGSIAVKQNLFNGGSTLANIRSALGIKDQASYNAHSQNMFFIVSTIGAYIDVVSGRLLRDVAKSSAKVYETELKAAQARFDVGEDTIAAVESIRAEYEGAKATLIEREMSLKQFESQYIRLVGEVPPADLETPKEPLNLPMSEEEVMRIALTHSLPIKIADTQAEIAEADVDNALSGLLPTVDFTASYGRQGRDAIPHTSSRTNTGALGVTLSMPLDVNGAIQTGVRAKKYTAASVKLKAIQERRKELQAVLKIWYTHQEQIAKIPQFKAQQKSADIAFENVQEEFRLGSKTYLDVITAEQKRLDASNKLIVAEATKVLSGFELLARMGILSPSIFGVTETNQEENTGKIWGTSIDFFDLLNEPIDPVVTKYEAL